MVHSANTLQHIFFTKRKLAPTKPTGEKLLWQYTHLNKTEVPFNTKSKSQFACALCFSPFSCPFSVSIHLLEAYYMSDIVLAAVLGNICSLSHVGLFETPWTVAHQAPLSMGFSRLEGWSGCHFSSRGSFRPRTEPWSPASSALTDGFFNMYHLGSLS